MGNCKKLMAQATNVILAVLAILNPLNLSAEEKSVFDEIEYVGEDKYKEKNTYTPDKFGYIRIGKSLYSGGGLENMKSDLGSLGISIIYDKVSSGFEHSYHVIDNFRYNDYLLTLGYRPEVLIKLKPGVLVGAGIGTRSNLDSGELTSGIAYFYDVNLELFKKQYGDYNFRMQSGLKKTSMSITNSQNGNITDYYLLIGIGW